MKWIIKKEMAGTLIKSFLIDVGRFSKRLLIKAKSDEGNILVNGEKKTVRYELKEGDILKVILPPEQPSAKLIREPIPLEIVYEDAYILVINKPFGIATIPSQHHPSGTIANGLLHYYEESGIEATVHIVTRLDRDTTGLMVIAKSQHCHALFSEIQREHALKRTYTAMIKGSLPTTSGTIDRPIGRKTGSIIERTIKEDGQRAVTHFTVVKRFEDKTLVHITLATGRTHQIRVHFSSIDHPLIGDDLYGDDTKRIGRHALHCSNIDFHHPYLNKRVRLNIPLPHDMQQVLSDT